MHQHSFKSRPRPFIFVVLLLTVLTIAVFGQIPLQKDMTPGQREKLLQLAREQGEKWRSERAAAEVLARRLNLPIRQTFADGRAIELQRFENGIPFYYVTDNLTAARTISTNRLWPGGTAGLSLNGSGQTLGIWDAGAVRNTHQEFGGRVAQSDGATALHTHATHVAGTMVAAGIQAAAQGMASGAQLQAYDWNNDVSEMTTAAASGLRVSNHSYGSINGWFWNTDSSKWFWYGNFLVSTTEDYEFGFYDETAQNWDNLARNAPFYLIVKSASNDRLEGPSAGTAHYHWDSEGFLLWRTDTHNIDGAPNGYDTIHDAGVAKDILTVGAVNDIPGGYTNSSDVVLASFSSCGPTDDGRIKPDVVANGVSLYSTDSTSNTAYTWKSGTSMSTPSVSGSIGLLLQHAQNLYGANANLLSSTMKALVIHTADEAGPSNGPDYQFGWGLMNTQKATQVMTTDATLGGSFLIQELTLTQGGQIQFQLNSEGLEPLRATICWTDPAGTPVTPRALNPRNPMLVNDLDLRIIRDSDGQILLPWSLNVNNPAAAATQADNVIDNVEQVYLATPTAGSYTLTVNHKGSLQGGAQQFSMVLTGQQKPSLSINDVALTEGNTGAANAIFTVYLNMPHAQVVTVNYATADGTAQAGSDYETTAGSLTFPAGSTTPLTISVPVYGDLLDEPQETFYVNLSSPSNALIVDGQGVGIINDDDAESALSINDVSVTEGNSGTVNAVFTVSLTPVSGQEVSVTWTAFDGTATSDDYQPASNTLVFSPGTTSLNFSVAVQGDLIDEPSEFFNVNLGGNSNSIVTDGQGIGTILDDDAPPSLSINDVSVTEGNSGQVNANFTVSFSAPSSFIVGFDYASANGTATSGSDYTAVSGTVTFVPGTTSFTIPVPVWGDALQEPNETLFINLSNPINATIADAQGMGTIIDDDLPTGGQIVHEETKTGGSTSSTSVATAASLTGVTGHFYLAAISTKPKVSVNAVSGLGLTWTLVKAQCSGRNATGVEIWKGQGTPSGNGVVTATLAATPNNAVIAVSRYSGVDPASPVGSVVSANTTGVNGVCSGGVDNTSYSFNLTTTVNGAVVYGAAAMRERTHTPGAGFTERAEILQGSSGSGASVAVMDKGVASPATITVNGSFNSTVDWAAAAIEIKPQSGGAMPSLSINDVSVTEGNAGTVNANFTVSLSAASGQVVSASYSTANGTATAGSDYVAGSGTVTFPAGSTSQTISVVVNGDVAVEGDETFFVNLSNPTNATIADGQGQGTIVNDDAGMPSIAINDVSVTEGTGGTVNASFTVSLSAASGQVVTVNYATANGTATAVNDYVAASGTVTFSAGTTTQSITVAVNSDELDEPDETFFINLSGATNATIADGQGQCTIIDDDPTPTISITDVSVTEGNSGNVNAVFTVTLSSLSGQTVTVNYATANGTATAGSDYVAGSGTITFPAVTLTQTLSVAVIGDVAVEANETFVVNLSGATNATIADGQGQGTINNDDASESAFTDIGASLTGVQTSSVAWGDYDSDGDLDVLLTGLNSGSIPIAKIYRNDAGSFVDIVAPLAGVYYSSVAWGDYDNDGDLDILLTGTPGSDAVAKVYRNDAGSFVDIAAVLAGVYAGSVAWGDYDNDGDLDIVLTGTPGSGGITKIYRNDAGSFVDIAAALTAVYQSSVAWGDYDNDGDLDILLTGSTGTSNIAKIYRNDAGSFVDIGAALAGVNWSSVAWGDYDNDSDLDILLAGSSSSGSISKVYRNDGGSFVDIAASLTGVFLGSVAWGDYDNDGDLDIFLAGSGYTKVYRNDAGSFTDIVAGLPGLQNCSAAWGDYDNDGKLDILLAGYAGVPIDAVISRIYRNNAATANSAPAAPTNLSANVSGSSVTFSWNKATDSQTPQNGLTYNLRLGTSSNGVQKMSPMANVSTGYRRVPKLGNTNHRNSWTIKNLANGTYYWSAQALDHAFAGSAFAAEKSFTIGGTPGNLALNKPATASSTYGSNTPNKAVDGSTSTYWRSGSVSSTTIVWLRVDLQSVYDLVRSVIIWNSSYYAKNYQLQVSTDDVNWTTVYTDNAGNGGTDDFTFASVSARYVRVYMTKNNKSSERIKEFQVYSGSSLAKSDFEESASATIPETVELQQNYPNPFNPSTTIRFALPEDAQVTLRVLNLVGQEVATLVDEWRPAGTHAVTFEPTHLPSGIYFYVMQAGEARLVRRLMLMK